MFRIDTLAKLTLSTGLATTLALVPLAGCASSGDAPQDVAPAVEDTTDAAEPTEAKDASEATPVWVASSYKMIQVDLEGNEGEYSSTYELDEAGNMISETDTSDEEGASEGYNYTYTYDEDGWLTKVVMDEETWTYELEKDDQGRVVLEKSEDFTREYTYNEQGFVSETLTTSIMFTVDENGDRVEGSEQTMTLKVTYDENGFPLTRSRTYQDGKAETEYAYEYGDDGLPVSYTTTTKNYDADGNEIEGSGSTTTGALEYDEHGNIVKNVVENDFATSTYEYTYVEVKNPSMAVQIQEHTRGI
jgi:YD repeat-containing protein